MAAARPTVLAIDGVIREVIETSGGGVFVSPGDDAAIAAAILHLQHCPDTRRQMGLSARDYVLKHFNRDQQAAELAKTMLRVANGNH
jgi:glycosyltransferase involved in cell wall biosynthesis